MKPLWNCVVIAVITGIFVCFAYSGEEAKQEQIRYAFDFQNSKDGIVYINGFSFDTKSDKEWRGKTLLYCLKKGLNNIRIISKEGKSSLKIFSQHDGITKNIFDLRCESEKQATIESTFELNEFPHSLSWEKADDISALDIDKSEDIRDTLQEYMNSMRDGSLDKIIATTLKYQFIDTAHLKGKTSDEGAKKAFKWFYAQMLAPDARQKYVENDSGIIFTKSQDNNKIIRACRRDKSPLMNIIDSTGTPFILTEVYLIRIEKKWYLF